jgi:outer membrane scaffolding protein for murein synthesis (MipA/OmpV family)
MQRLSEQRIVLTVILALAAVHAPGSLVLADDKTPPRTQMADDDDDDEPASKVEKRLPDANEAFFSPLATKNWKVELGSRVLVVPRRIGDNAIKPSVGATYDIVWNKTVFLTSERGLGVNIFHQNGIITESDKFTAGLAVNYDDRSGVIRSQSQLRSLDIRQRNAVYALGFADYRVGNWYVWAEAGSFRDRHNGNVYTSGAEYNLSLTDKWSMIFASGLSFGDSAHMRENYGVPFSSAAQYGVAAYHIPAGFSDATFSAQLEYQADKHWSWTLTGGQTVLLGDAARSPRVETRSQPFMSAAVKYKF